MGWWSLFSSSKESAATVPATTPTPKKESILPKDESFTTTNNKSDQVTTSSTMSSEEKNLSGMPLVHYKCRKKKRIYEQCVSRWYTEEFMTGKSLYQSEVCGEKFELYRKCVLKGIKKEVWDKAGLPPPKEGSPLAELDED